MPDDDLTEFCRVPGLYRLWDLQLVINREDDFQIHYAELTEDGAPLFAVYRRPAEPLTLPGAGDTR